MQTWAIRIQNIYSLFHCEPSSCLLSLPCQYTNCQNPNSNQPKVGFVVKMTLHITTTTTHPPPQTHCQQFWPNFIGRFLGSTTTTSTKNNNRTTTATITTTTKTTTKTTTTKTTTTMSQLSLFQSGTHSKARFPDQQQQRQQQWHL